MLLHKFTLTKFGLVSVAMGFLLILGTDAKPGNARPALQCFDCAHVLAQHPPTRADQLLQAGDRQFQTAAYREAVQTYQQALAGYRQEHNRVGEGDALLGMGLSYYRLGQYQRSLEAFQQALTAHQAARDSAASSAVSEAAVIVIRSRDRIREAINGMGLVYFQLGQYEKSLEHHQRAWDMSGRGPNYYGWDGQILNQIGNVYAKQGQYARALAYYQQALVIVDAVGYPLGRDGKARPKPINEVIDTIYGWQRQRQPLDRLEQALQLTYYEPIRLHPWARTLLVTTLNNIGDVYAVTGPSARAMQYYLQALRVSRFIDDPALLGRVLNNVGKGYHRLGQHKDALDFYQEALGISQKIRDRALEGMTLNNMGIALLEAGKTADAAQRLTAAIAVWESLRPGLADANMVSLFETQVQTYQQLQQALITQNRFEQALAIAERGRARAFVELLARRLNSASTLDQQSIPPPTLAQIKQVAQQQNATLITYSVIGDESLYIWVVKPAGDIAFRRVDLQPILRRSPLEDYIASIRIDGVGVRGRGSRGANPAPDRNPTDQLTTPGLQQLHQWLIDPIADLLPTDPNARVVFIPHGALFLVPFAALQDQAGRYLVEKQTIAIAPSIQVLALTRQLKTAGTSLGASLIVGNPTMPSVVIEAGQPPEQLSSLPGAEAEAKAVATLLNTQALIGNAATKSVVMRQMGQVQLTHLATHGLLDDFKGMGVPGAIALAPSGQDNGLLTADEILDMRLQTGLIVLSACDTGRGRITGDGVIGLSRSLLSAGAPSVIVSLWAVPDIPTTTLMTAFYQNLQQGTNKAQALRQAMLTTMRQYPTPRDWAAFVLIGEAN